MDFIFRFIWKHPWLLLLASALLITVTGPKMYKMVLIRGWVPGATVRRKIVTDMKMTASSGRVTSNAYWVSWDGQGASRIGPKRMNLPEEVYKGIEIGDELEVITLFGEKTPYHREGIFASNGNFIFDVCLLCFELFLFGAGLYRIDFKRPKQVPDETEFGPLDSRDAFPSKY